MFDLFLFNLLVKVAPVTAGDDELVDLELRMNAHCPIKQISVQRIGRGKPDAGQTIFGSATVCPSTASVDQTQTQT